MQNRGISGVNLNNLNISNSVTYGLSIIYGAGGALANAIMSNVNIPNYGVGASGVHGLWARSDAVGSMTVSNCSVVEYKNDSSNFTFNFVTSNIPVTVQTSPSGQTFTVDGTNYSSAQAFNWPYGSSHSIATSSPQSGGTGVQYVWGSWSDGGATSHTVTAISNATYTANFTTQYYLTMNAGTGGNVSPVSGWNNSNAVVNISATASNGYSFSSWTGSGSGSYSGSNSAASVTMNGPVTETANFTPNIAVTVQASLAGLSFTVDGTTYTNAQIFSWIPGSNHAIVTTTPQSGGIGVQYAWSFWSDGGAISHAVSPTVNTTYTANFTTQYYLTMNTGPGGSVSPVSDWYDSGTNVDISATAWNGYTFGTWAGTGGDSYSGTNNPASVTINGPITQTASFNLLAQILSITIGGDGSLTISYATIPGDAYHVETTTNLSSSAWTTVPGSTTNAAESIIIFIDPNAVGDQQRFYRVASP